MKRFSLFLAIFGGYLWLIFASLYPPIPSQQNPFIFYSNQLRDDLKQVTLRALKQAKKSILIQIYGLTDSEVLSLLEKKVEEGVSVTIFYDKKASKSLPKTLPAFPVKSSGLMHRKILVIDDELVFLGTANFTTQSLKMHDNLILGLWNPQLAFFFSTSIDDTGAFEVAETQITSFLLPDVDIQAAQNVIDKIDQAQKTIQIAMFTLTHKKILTHLEAAIKRGVEVTIAIDRYTALGASKQAIERLKKAGAHILTSTGSQLLHHKWALIDKKTLIFGSANWTKSAFLKNQDCILVIDPLGKKEEKKMQRLLKVIAIASERG